MRTRKTSGKLATATLLALFLAACSSTLQPAAPTTDEPRLSAQATTVDRRVASATDVAEEYGGTVYFDSPVLELGEKTPGTVQHTGLRFTNITVPKGADVVDAYLEFRAVTSQSGTTTLAVYGHDVANAGAFGSGASSVTARTKTSTGATWSVSPWTDGGVYKTPNLASVVRELTSRSDWTSGNAMAFMLSGTGLRKAQSFSAANSTLSPRLVISYNAASPPPPPPATSCLRTPYTSTGTKTVSGTNYIVRGQTNYRLNAQGLYVKSPKDDPTKKITVDGKQMNGTRQAFQVTGNSATSSDSVSVCINGVVVEVVIPVGERWEPYYHASGSFYASNSPGIIFENVASIRGGDGFTLKDYNDRAIIRDSYIGRAGDDGVENDRLNNVTVDNILVDSAFQGFSCQQETERNDPRRGINGGKRNFVIKNTLLALRKERGGGYGSYKLWKFATGDTTKLDESNTNCKLFLQNNVFLLTSSNDNVKIDPAEYNNVDDVPIVYSECRNNTIVYTGTDNSYWQYLQNAAALRPTCWKVTREINVWRAARAKWFDNHPSMARFEANEAGRFE